MNDQPNGGSATDRTARWRRWLTWRRILVVVALLIVATVGVRRFMPVNVDDGFVAFEPSVAMFPAAPVADAETVIGVGATDQWFDGPDFCPYSRFDNGGIYSAVGKDWHSVRHDWSEGGANKAWIISQRTRGFADLKEFDTYLTGFRDRVKYCGWEYGHAVTGRYNGILTELDGLPDDSYAFTIDASPLSIEDPDFGDSNPDDFAALGAVLPGHKRGQLMFVMWVGWGVDVPTDEFVAAANRLYDAAHQAAKPSYEGEDGTIDFDFDEYGHPAAGVSSLIGGGDSGGGPDFRVDICGRVLVYNDLRQLAEPDHEAGDALSNDVRSVRVLTARWRERSGYFTAKREMSRIIAPLCIGTLQQRSFLIEPITVPGLPEGTLVAVWRPPGEEPQVETYAALLTDDERQLSMVVVWRERKGPIPTDLFVEAVNTAWADCLAANP